MARLPTPGGDDGNWGTILNQYLRAEHDATGSHHSLLYSSQTLTDGETINWNTANGAYAEVTLGGNRILSNPTGLIKGASYILLIKQDATGGRTLDFGDVYKFPDGTAPTLSTEPNAVDIIAFISDGTNMYGSFVGNFN